MILDDNTVSTILNATSIAKMFGIEQFIIEPHIIRGISDDRSAAIFTPCDIDIGCAAVGVNRIEILQNRLALSNGNSIDCISDGPLADASMLIIKSSKLNVEYRCAKIKGITAPKELKVADLYEISIDADLAGMINKGKSAMKAEELAIMCNDNRVSYKIYDDNNDKLVYDDSVAVNLTSDDDINFTYVYPIKSIIQAFTKCTDNKFYITNNGMLHIQVSNIDVYIPIKK
jgi:hypothetical protein